MSAAHSYGDFYGDGGDSADDHYADLAESHVEECRERCYRGDHMAVSLLSTACACGRRPFGRYALRTARRVLRHLKPKPRPVLAPSRDEIPF